MSDNNLPLSRPTLGEEEIREIIDVIQSGWITSGPRVKRFEEEFARYVGARHAVAVNSCTAALHVAILAHGIGPGDEVITSSMTWSATANMIEVTGAKPVFADIDRDNTTSYAGERSGGGYWAHPRDSSGSLCRTSLRSRPDWLPSRLRAA